jgi:flavin-dependent dehydrogenase
MFGTARSNQFTLENGSKIAVVGGGPAGSFFSIFALKMSKMLGKDISIAIFDSKDFDKSGPGGCNRCGGVISELLVQTLAVEGINLPESVVQKGIDSYNLHTARGSVFIVTPSHEKTIATVYRGGGPKGIIGEHKESFDKFLLEMAIEEGAVHNPVKIDRIGYKDKRPVLYANGQMTYEADLVVGACGVNSSASKIFEDMGFGYTRPVTTTAAIAELSFNGDIISEHFGNAIHLFLLPVKNIKFGAMIPKGTYVTLCLLGKDLNAGTIQEFLDNPAVKKALPASVPYEISCRCLPKMNIRASKIPYADRVVMCGDAGSTRLYKDGLGAAYLMGKAAAKTAVFQGVSKEHFKNDYYPVYKSIIIDNWFGIYLYSVIGLYRKYGFLTKGMVRVVRDEQQDPDNPRRLSSILWDMFTGNERYKNIFGTAVSMPMHFDIWKELAKILMRR